MRDLHIDRWTPLEHLPELLSVPEAATWLGVSDWLVWESAKRGRLEHVRLGRRVLITKRGLAALAGASMDGEALGTTSVGTAGRQERSS